MELTQVGKLKVGDRIRWYGPAWGSSNVAYDEYVESFGVVVSIDGDILGIVWDDEPNDLKRQTRTPRYASTGDIYPLITKVDK